MRYAKSIIGIVLIISALAGGYYWETKGRQSYQQIQIPVTSVDIQKGERFNSQILRNVYIEKSSMVKGALLEKDLHKIADQRATQFIPANSQIVATYFTRDNRSFSDGKSVFSIPASWIFSKSSTLRKGDWVEIYGEEEALYLGDYKLAFVKDQGEVEIENPEGPFIEKNILERTGGSGIIHHLEVYCTLEEYWHLLEYIKATGMGLLIVQREGLE